MHGVLHSSNTYLFDEKRKVYHHSFGSALEDSLENIWKKEDYYVFREKVSKFNFSPCVICGGCENWKENKEDALVIQSLRVELFFGLKES
ncbi:hypothetical protein TPELB_05980 [Terrisporobacter petrolearius]|uniref:4Fe4S-binding SPASM domain-containing protein n=1 Tax=Terrisporobacter petrolearius TaxID=1460447 RepID=A0ABZ3FC27_9FIRM